MQYAAKTFQHSPSPLLLCLPLRSRFYWRQLGSRCEPTACLAAAGSRENAASSFSPAPKEKSHTWTPPHLPPWCLPDTCRGSTRATLSRKIRNVWAFCFVFCFFLILRLTVQWKSSCRCTRRWWSGPFWSTQRSWLTGTDEKRRKASGRWAQLSFTEQCPHFQQFFFLPCRSIYSNSPPTKSHEPSRHLKTNSIIKLHINFFFKNKKLIHQAIYLPKSLKKEAISCRWMTKEGALVILRGCLSSVRWLVRLVPVGFWVPWPWALFSWRRLLIWRECGLSLGVTQTVTEGGVRRHVLVCFIPALFRSSDVKGASGFGEGKQKCNINSTKSI